MNYLKITSAAALIFLLPCTALAHPHIFVRYRVAMEPADAGYMRLHFTFKINAAANPFYAPGAKSNDNPQLAKDMLANLAAHPFFLFLDMDGESVGRQEVRAIPDKIAGTYSFDLTLPQNNGGFGFSLYDPEYFVSVRQDGEGAMAVKAKDTVCAVDIRKMGETAWGAIHAEYVACGSKSSGKPLVRAPLKQPQGVQNEKIGGPDLLP